MLDLPSLCFNIYNSLMITLTTEAQEKILSMISSAGEGKSLRFLSNPVGVRVLNMVCLLIRQKKTITSKLFLEFPSLFAQKVLNI